MRVPPAFLRRMHAASNKVQLQFYPAMDMFQFPWRALFVRRPRPGAWPNRHWGAKYICTRRDAHIDSGSHPSVAVMCPAIRYSPCKTRPRKINKARCCNECVVPREGVMRQSLCARPGRPCAHARARCPRLRRSRPLSLRHICARRPWPSQATRNHLGWRKHTELST